MSESGGKVSAEFRLVAACCRWPTDVAAIRAAASAPIDWARAIRLSRRHRVIGFLRVGLVAAGIAVPPRLDQLYVQAVQRNLLHHAEALRLADRLAEAGIPAVFLKGVVLAELAYGDQRIKQTVDNDLLVAPKDVQATVMVIEGMGYELKSPPVADPARWPLVIHMFKECQFVHPVTTAIVDLHWRMHSIKRLLDEPDIAAEAQTVMVGGKALPTLLGDTMMLYLATHGARHSWARIKWLADFNALLGLMDDAAVAAMRTHAARDGVAPCVDAALIQCERLFGADVPREVYRSRRARGLVRLADELIFGRDQHLAPRCYTAVWLASAPLMKTRPRFLGHLAWDLWVAPDDALALPLPRSLHPLYAVISPIRRVGRIARRLTARGFAKRGGAPMRAAQEK